MNVLTQRTEQLLLQWADLAFRIQNHHIDVFHAVEGVGNRRTGITRCCGQNGDLTAVRNRRQRLGHKTTTKVFKRQRRTVEQLQRINAVFN